MSSEAPFGSAPPAGRGLDEGPGSHGKEVALAVQFPSFQKSLNKPKEYGLDRIGIVKHGLGYIIFFK